MLRVLLIDDDPIESERIAAKLEKADHTVLPLNGFDEAAEALEVQRFDAVILPVRTADEELASFTSKLREIEAGRRGSTRVPVLTYMSNETTQTVKPKVDGYLPPDFAPILFAETVFNLASGVNMGGSTPARAGSASATPALPIFNSDEFEEQMGFDADLIVELIDLFLTESASQIIEMHDALRAADFQLLCRVAHTIKGSFGSFYALQASAHAQGLELAAKNGDAASCGPLLEAVASDLDVLKPELIALRNARLGS